MVKLDEKNKKILYQLDINSRQSLSDIEKKTGIHQNAVKYRINKLEERGVIENYYTVIDSLKLGYLPVKFYLKFQFTVPKIEEEIINFFKNNNQAWWVASLEGRYDIAVHMLVRNFDAFSNFWDEIMNKYIDYIEERLFCQYFYNTSYEYSYLSDKQIIKNRKKYEMINDGKIIDIDNIDLKILKIIAPNARIHLTELEKKLNLTSAAIINRIKKLQSLRIIQGYRVNINLQKIGYENYKIDIYLGDYKKRSDIINYIKNNRNLVFICKSAGISDLELGFHVQNLNQLLQIVKDMQIKFPSAIKNYQYLHVRKQHLWKYMPTE